MQGADLIRDSGTAYGWNEKTMRGTHGPYNGGVLESVIIKDVLVTDRDEPCKVVDIHTHLLHVYETGLGRG